MLRRSPATKEAERGMAEMVRPRVCVCLSGQMRRFEGSFGWLHRLRAEADVQVVVATWRERGAKITGPMNASRLNLVLPAEIGRVLPAEWKSDRFFEVFPRLRRLMIARAEGGDITREAIERETGPAEIHVEDAFPFGFFENRQRDADGTPQGSDPYTLRQFYKVFQAGVMKRNLEQRDGRPFDAVIRLRPDKSLGMVELPTLLGAGPDVLFADHFRAGAAGDQLAAGSSAALDRYAGFFTHAFARVAAGAWREVHVELHDWLVSQNLSVRPMPHQHGLSADALLSTEEVMAELRESAEGPAPLGPQAAYVLRTLQADRALRGGNAAGAAALAAQGLDAPPGIGMSGRLVVLGRALEGDGDRRAAFLAGVLSLVGQSANSLMWQGPGNSNEELNLMFDNAAAGAPGFLRVGADHWALVEATAAALAKEGGAAALLRLLDDAGFRETVRATLRDAMEKSAVRGGLQVHLSHLAERAGLRVEAAERCEAAVALLPHDGALRARLEQLRAA
ncbi:hypothetical protein [Roseomonas elaeocarpi]|uniref:Glycosyltransferase n=1 Tax=Roseomonas elaeocarpi TaxID=907779 RepID=A0ABV6JXQ8_9PROT